MGTPGGEGTGEAGPARNLLWWERAWRAVKPVLNIIGAVVEIITALALLIAPEPAASKVAGAFLLLHGIDSLRTAIWGGQSAISWLVQQPLVRLGGMDPADARLIGDIANVVIPLVVGGAASLRSSNGYWTSGRGFFSTGTKGGSYLPGRVPALINNNNRLTHFFDWRNTQSHEALHGLLAKIPGYWSWSVTRNAAPVLWTEELATHSWGAVRSLQFVKLVRAPLGATRSLYSVHSGGGLFIRGIGIGMPIAAYTWPGVGYGIYRWLTSRSADPPPSAPPRQLAPAN
jgi:hypothetical protein